MCYYLYKEINKKRGRNNMAGSKYLNQVKRGMVNRLFNTEYLQRVDVQPTKIAEIAGISKTQLYRLYRKWGFNIHDNYSNELSKDEIADRIWKSLTGWQIEQLYTWARDRRFDNHKAPSKRPYHLTDEGREGLRKNRSRTADDEKREEAQNAEIIANAGIEGVEPVPTPENTEAKPTTLADDLHDFVTTNRSTAKQSDSLIKALLFGSKPSDIAVQQMEKKVLEADDFNEKQWAFQQLYTRSGRQAQADFMQILNGLKDEKEIEGRKDPQTLLHAYRQNENKIDLKQIK